MSVYEPGEHLRHTDEPVTARYVPGKQYRHVELELAPICVENVPGLHVLQYDMPVELEYVPAGQGVCEDEPGFDAYDPLEQVIQVVMDVAPIVFDH